ncbi:LytTR family DNA-binding domain-containing protein [Croceibacterium sp. TMG7-5b_MA50]|uniref:LytR/AlgR family response regulator transcription factor n=1 Tax=Croceibacterium sp. TMG7-5b_MA50 TaxID=3121290 RepID=UPI0032219060
MTGSVAQASADAATVLRTLIVDDEPLAIERMQVLCAGVPGVQVIGTASDGESALRLAERLRPDLLLLDMTMPGPDGLATARRLAQLVPDAAVIFVTAHGEFAVQAFDIDAVDYLLKPVAADRLSRAVDRALARHERGGGVEQAAEDPAWLTEFWVPHRSELLRIDAGQVERIDAERDYVRLHVTAPDGQPRSHLLLQTIAGLEERLDPQQFLRIHRSVILRRDRIHGLRHEGLGVWCVELADGTALRIGRTYLRRVKAMAGR